MRCRSMRRTAALFVCATILSGGYLGATSGQAAEQFYQGKTIRVIVRSSPGGTYDAAARLLARYMPQYIPGKTTFIVVNMDGAGGVVAANYLANTAKRDGTEFATLSSSIAISQRLRSSGIKYDVRKLISLGSVAGEVFTLAVKAEFPVNNLTQLRAFKETVQFSADGAGSGAAQFLNAMRNDGFPIKLILGYRGSSAKVLAVVRGEVDATGSSLGGLGGPDGVRQNGLKIIGHINKIDDPVLANSEDMVAAMTPKLRPLMELLAAPEIVALPFFLPPEVPADRVALLRQSFKQALDDPGLRREATRAHQDIDYVGPEEMDKMYRNALGVSDDLMKGLD